MRNESNVAPFCSTSAACALLMESEAQTRHAALEAFNAFATNNAYLTRHQLKAAWIAVFGSHPHKVRCAM